MAPRIWLIAGPTASGKSALALRLAEAVGGEIVNADSMQLYASLRVITAGPSPAEAARAPHHLFGAVDPGDGWSVGRWLRAATEVLDGIERWLPRAGEDVDSPARGTVFKIVRRPSGEKLVYVRLFVGSLAVRQRVTVQRRDVLGDVVDVRRHARAKAGHVARRHLRQDLLVLFQRALGVSRDVAEQQPADAVELALDRFQHDPDVRAPGELEQSPVHQLVEFGELVDRAAARSRRRRPAPRRRRPRAPSRRPAPRARRPWPAAAAPGRPPPGLARPDP